MQCCRSNGSKSCSSKPNSPKCNSPKCNSSKCNSSKCNSSKCNSSESRLSCPYTGGDMRPRSSLRRMRSSLKNCVRRREQSSSMKPRNTSTWWLNPLSSTMFMTLPQQPAFGFMAPMTMRGSLAWIMAPAHMEQGSSVTYMVQASKRQSPIFLEAFFIAVISAWEKVE